MEKKYGKRLRAYLYIGGLLVAGWLACSFAAIIAQLAK